MMNAEEIPNWVPAAVKKLAVQDGFAEELVQSAFAQELVQGRFAEEIVFAQELVRRLVTDPKMKSVWQYLLRAQPVVRVSEMGVSVQEQACAFFFQDVLTEMCRPTAATTRRDVENSVARWHSAAELCRSGLDFLSSSSDNPKLVEALSLGAKYFEVGAEIAGEDANSPYTLERRRGEPEDNTVRGRIRALVLITYALYGSPLWGVLARVATVALQKDVTHRSVRNWCSDLRVARKTPQPAERPISPAQPS
jgi:hypothetical protein